MPSGEIKSIEDDEILAGRGLGEHFPCGPDGLDVE